ncbi:MAG TPA: hypothetical protein VK553_03225 [Candidatus Nitrosopolaris rasttigaisensis]|nr:hypothetical protein [Candidatus Nitrosopolaris rasttigaisensis]
MFEILLGDEEPVIDYFLDTAYDKDNGRNDPSVILACTKIKENLYVTGVSQVWMELPQFLVHLENYTKQTGYTSRSRIMVEGASTGKPIVQIFKTTSLNVIEVKIPQANKGARLNAISAKVEAEGKVNFVQGSWNSLAISEICYTAKHDDIADAFIMAVIEKLIKSRNHGKYNISII